MSLRVFHIIFIGAAILLSAFVAAWGLRQFTSTGNWSGLSMGIVFIACGFALVVYGLQAFRKLRELP
jgi:apolipoprotein N-acyltransferase